MDNSLPQQRPSAPKSGKTESKPANKRRNKLIKLRPLLRWIIRLRSTPEALAGGFALGVFITFTPTVGLQFIAVLILATLLKMNRAASAAPIWISNPLTVAPIYSFNYWIGLQFCEGPPLKQVSGLFADIGKSMAKMEVWQIKEQFAMMLHIGKDVIWPLCIGSVLVGLVCGVISYFFSLHLLRILFNRRKRKQLRAADEKKGRV